MNFIDSATINSDAGITGNYFVWKNMDVKKFHAFKWIDTDASILDAYVNVYLYSGITATDGAYLFPPEVSSMDNMYVLSDDTSLFPV